jgi:hypothetical protein
LSVLEVEEEYIVDDGEGEDEIPDDLASAILKNPLPSGGSRSSSRASNPATPMTGVFGALQQPISPLMPAYSSSSPSSSGAAGLANLIMAQTPFAKDTPLTEEDDKTPEAEKASRFPEVCSSPATTARS